VTGFCHRLPNSRYDLKFDAPIEPVGSANNEEDVKALLTQIFSRFEHHIGRNPEQWVLLQPVWPH
jgi:lauroyl/myristoyl acyltransferase